jgi:uncharacterized membrane protein
MDESLPPARRFTLGFPILFWVAVIGCSVLSMTLLAARLSATRQSGHLSLSWDLFLAWLPVFPAIAVFSLAQRERPHRGLVAALGMVWLLFFPNSPYLVTQMIHLNPLYGPSRRPLPATLDAVLPAVQQQPSPEWFDFLLIASIVVTGLLLTFASLRLMHRAIALRVGHRLAIAAAAWLVLLGSFGVALGRFARLNSWEVFSQPAATASAIVRWIAEPRVGVSTLVLSLLLMLLYVAFVQAGVAPSPLRGGRLPTSPRSHEAWKESRRNAAEIG